MNFWYEIHVSTKQTGNVGHIKTESWTEAERIFQEYKLRTGPGEQVELRLIKQVHLYAPKEPTKPTVSACACAAA